VSAPPDLRLKTSDFPGVDWIDKLIRPLMIFALQTQGGLTKSLTFAENISSQQLEFSLQMQGGHTDVVLNAAWGNVPSIPDTSFQPPSWRKTPDGLIVLAGACALGHGAAPAFSLPETAWPEMDVHGTCFASFDGMAGVYRLRVSRYGVVYIGEGSGGVCDFAYLNTIYEAKSLTPVINGAFPFVTRLTLARPVGVVPLRVVELPSPRDERPVSKALSVDWSVQNDKLVIHDIPGLQPGKNYKLTLLVYGG